VIKASQTGNVDYDAAAAVSRSLNITKANQVITFAVLASKTLGTADFSPGATSSSGLAISYSSSDTSVATIAAGNIHLKAAGTSVISAVQTGNINYNAAPKINRTLTVKPKTANSVNTWGQVLAGKSETNNVAAPSIRVQQGISPNGDGFNDVLVIDGIKSFPENKVTLVDRNGVKVYEHVGYNNERIAFDGHSSVTGKLQYPGTYFYLIEYKIDNKWKRKTGFFVLKY
jgi:gliding motility-associated-like protein